MMAIPRCVVKLPGPAIMEVMKLSELTSFRIGGEAREVIEVRRTSDLAGILAELRLAARPFFVLGGGTNVLAADEGFDGAILLMRTAECVFHDDGTVAVDAGFDMQEFVHEAAARGFGGLEWAGGLPGSVGGAVRGNAGCFGGEMKDAVLEVSSIVFDGSQRTRQNHECGFSYRTSIFKTHGDEIVTRAALKLVPGQDPAALRAAVEEKIVRRTSRHPLEYPNAGSIFKNVPAPMLPPAARERFRGSLKTDPFPVLPAAKLIFAVGLAGRECGRAQISPKHANFIVNLGGASAGDVTFLIGYAATRVGREFGVSLEKEICFLG